MNSEQRKLLAILEHGTEQDESEQTEKGASPLYGSTSTWKAPEEKPMSLAHLLRCQACQTLIDISKMSAKSVVRCNQCHEATSINGRAPPGQKYVRCPCKCLLICHEAAVKIACPRPGCRRIISLVPKYSFQTPNAVPIFTCAYCYNQFLFDIPKNALNRCTYARCPDNDCKKVSSIGGPKYGRKWGIIFMILSMIFIGAGIGVICTTAHMKAATEGGIYVVYVGLFLMAFLSFIRSLYYWTMKVSLIQGST
jgi:phosphatidylinositol-4,5-bisphosphate 4-phosphatase